MLLHIVRHDITKMAVDAIVNADKEAARFGIDEDHAVNYKCDQAGTALNYATVSDAVCDVRAARPLRTDWKHRIEEDVKRRRR